MNQQHTRSMRQFFALLAIAFIFAASSGQSSAESATQPMPKLSPTDVVNLQLKAIQHNDRPQTDAGIATVFRFTSPGNRARTGPLPHFAQMIHAGYAAMIDYQSATLEPVIRKGDAALQPVDLIDHDGEAHRYIFVLSLQQDAPYKDCWMTDSVLSDADEHPKPSDLNTSSPLHKAWLRSLKIV